MGERNTFAPCKGVLCAYYIYISLIHTYIIHSKVGERERERGRADSPARIALTPIAAPRAYMCSSDARNLCTTASVQNPSSPRAREREWIYTTYIFIYFLLLSIYTIYIYTAIKLSTTRRLYPAAKSANSMCACVWPASAIDVFYYQLASFQLLFVSLRARKRVPLMKQWSSWAVYTGHIILDALLRHPSTMTIFSDAFNKWVFFFVLFSRVIIKYLLFFFVYQRSRV